MNSRVFLVGLGVLVAALALAGCSPRSPEPAGGEAGIANPASVHCEEQGYTLEIRTASDGGQYGVCIFDDGTECEEWVYYRGECSPGQHQTAPEP